MSTSTHLNPSQTSSQRTSLETATLSRSSTQVSPTLDPARTSSVSSTTTQTASARRNRAALRDFYGLQNQKQQEQQGGNGTAESNAFHEEPYASHLDETAFNREEYVSHLLRTSDLAHILRTESALISGTHIFYPRPHLIQTSTNPIAPRNPLSRW